jgi:hypothetical protein
MLEIGAIRESSSPYSSNLVLVRKSDGFIRLCSNHRGVNRKTKSVGPVENTAFHLQIKSCSLPFVLGVKCFKSISRFFLKCYLYWILSFLNRWYIYLFYLNRVNLVKSTNKRPIKVGSMSVLTVSGICKSKTVLETAVTECVDDTKGTLGVCPRKSYIPIMGYFNVWITNRKLNRSQYVCTNHYWNRFVIICFRYNQ